MTSQLSKPDTAPKITQSEIHSGMDRQAWAENLIRQLPANHDGRNSWLLNYGRGEEARNRRTQRDLTFNEESQAINPPSIPAQSTLKPVAWRYQLADMRIWHNGVPDEYTDWHWKVSEHEPNAGEGMRNVTPLYEHPPAIPPQGGSAQLQKSQAKEPEASGGLCAIAPRAVQVGEPTRIGAVVGDQEAAEPSLIPKLIVSLGRMADRLRRMGELDVEMGVPVSLVRGEADLLAKRVEELRASVPPQDAHAQRPTTDREVLAKIIFDAIPFDGIGQAKPRWVPGGNSIRQDEARHCADSILAVCVLPVTPQNDPAQGQPKYQAQYNDDFNIATGSSGSLKYVATVTPHEWVSEVRDFLQDIVGGAEVTERSREHAKEFVARLESPNHFQEAPAPQDSTVRSNNRELAAAFCRSSFQKMFELNDERTEAYIDVIAELLDHATEFTATK